MNFSNPTSLPAGESHELQLRYTPRGVGNSVVLGICDIVGAPEPTGFAVTSAVRGLDTMYELYTPAQFEAHEVEQRAYDEGRSVRPVDNVEDFRGLSGCLISGERVSFPFQSPVVWTACF